MKRIILDLPPTPNFISVKRTHYREGEQYAEQNCTGVYGWLFVIRGALSIGEGKSLWQVEKGQSILLLPDRHYISTASCHNETIFYEVRFDYLGPYREDDNLACSPPDRLASTTVYPLIISQYGALQHCARIERLLKRKMGLTAEEGPSEYWRGQQRFMELLHLLDEEQKDQHCTLTSVRRLAELTESYLRRCYEQELTNEVLAEALHFHSNYIVRCMKEVYGCTPLEYLIQYRLEQAMHLLSNTELSVAEVAERVGFKYAPYFSNCFSRYKGSSPMQYRKRQRAARIPGTNENECNHSLHDSTGHNLSARK
ncbi:helix-turn-helix transcriptional regulator [Paenibacillus sp. PR3]|uniref:Helix-turn-helix transcriptional regulator n=1 Tax=Paenibacillus terricola TaxID=2763503 RepID=A0ABR8N1L3_9BACL|nr:AraC family transcriptional regulator [Paenibacillus terricola]MBD3921760.1 helix-turn-helix transcriptional regulator [Paenibacillus terricola]